MEITDESDWDEKQNVHSQIAYLIADITARPVISIEIDENESGEYVYVYKPGFSKTFGALPPYSDDDEVHYLLIYLYTFFFHFPPIVE